MEIIKEMFFGIVKAIDWAIDFARLKDDVEEELEELETPPQNPVSDRLTVQKQIQRVYRLLSVWAVINATTTLAVIVYFLLCKGAII